MSNRPNSPNSITALRVRDCNACSRVDPDQTGKLAVPEKDESLATADIDE